MKKSILFLSAIAVMAFATVKAQSSDGAGKKTSNAEINFEKPEHDFGTIANGGNGVYEFAFKNTGAEPLIISNASGSCGCTVPDWPKEPIKPGTSGKVKVSYDTKRTGPFTKTVTVNTNGKTETTVLTIKGTVEEPVKEETMPIKKSVEGATPLANPSKSK